MNRRIAFIAASLATTLGVVCLVLYQERFERERSGGEPVPVLMAARDIPLSTLLTPQMLAVHEIPEAYVEPRHIRASEAERIMGLRVSSAVRANESLLWTDLADSEQRRDLSGLVPEGMRAFTIRSDPTSSFGGLLRPGDRVDVLLTVERGSEHETGPIAQNLLVLATGRDTGAQDGSSVSAGSSPSQITLGVSLEQSQTLALGQQRGTVALVLRNPEDIRIVEQLPAETSQRLLSAIRSGGLSRGRE
jgi:pilus assembly protein CpaB